MMRWLIAVVTVLFALVPAPASAQSYGDWYTVRYVVDGDTIWVNGLGASIRFAGVDAPEIGRPCATEAKQLVEALVYPDVVVEFARPLRDVYGRYRAYIRYPAQGGDLSTVQEALLSNGLATMDRGRFTDPRYAYWFDLAENDGKANGRGLWGGACSGGGTIWDDTQPILPPPPPTPVPTPGIVPPLTRNTCPATHPIKLNANSGIYHVPGGQFYNATNPEACARTEADAIAAGYRKSLR